MQRTLTDASVRDRASKLFVGLSAPCDAPAREAAVSKLMSANLKNANTLPFVAVLTDDLKWVTGFSGHRTAEQFAADLDIVDKSPLLDASPAVAKKLEKIATKADKHAEKRLWSKLLACEDDASELTGRHPARDRITAHADKARAFAETSITEVIKSLSGDGEGKGGGDRTAARKTLMRLAKDFRGQPAADDATIGIKAVDRVARLAKLEGDAREGARKKFAKEFEDSRWTQLFGGTWPKE